MFGILNWLRRAIFGLSHDESLAWAEAMLAERKRQRDEADRRHYENRKIYRYSNGSGIAMADPLACWIELVDDPTFNFEVHPAGIDRGDTEAYKAGIQAVRRIFNVKPLADGGLTDQECLELLIDYLAYMGSLKKSTNSTPILPQPTESEFSGTPAGSATNAA